MEILFQDDQYKEWQVFISSENLNLWSYTRKFQLQCGLNKIKDLSFAVIENKTILAICPLYVTPDGKYNQFSDRGGYLRSPIVSSALPERKIKKVYNLIFKTIDELAFENDAAKALLMFDPQPDYRYHNLFLEYDYIDASLLTQIIDLSKPKEDLWMDIRKSYKGLINKGLKIYNFHIMTRDNAEYEIHEKYRLTHFKAAGRATRSKETFDLQFEQLRAGEATLISVLFEGKYVQLNYFNHYNNYVHYASAADDPDFSSTCMPPMGHAIIWQAIKYFKENNYKYLELGLQYFGNQLFEYPSEKKKMISYFKRGFGGSPYPLYRGVKYYNKSLLKCDILKSIDYLLL